jgi:hypothetical protein
MIHTCVETNGVSAGTWHTHKKQSPVGATSILTSMMSPLRGFASYSLLVPRADALGY